MYTPFPERSSDLYALVFVCRYTEAAQVSTLSLQLLFVTLDKTSSNVFIFLKRRRRCIMYICGLVQNLSPKCLIDTRLW